MALVCGAKLVTKNPMPDKSHELILVVPARQAQSASVGVDRGRARLCGDGPLGGLYPILSSPEIY